MSISEFHAAQQHKEVRSAAAHWISLAMITGAAFLAFATLAYVLV